MPGFDQNSNQEATGGLTTGPPQSVEIEPLLRDAMSGVAVSAFARGIELSVHIDHRLPGRAFCDGAALGAFLRRGLARTIEAGHTDKIVLAVWRDEGDEGEPRMLLEVGRARNPAEPHGTRLAELWRLPIGGETAAARPHRQDASAETALVPLPCVPDPGAPPLAEKWQETFRGRYVLHVRDIVCDEARFRASIAATGAEVEITVDPAAGLALARERVAAGKPVDILMMDAPRLGRAAVELARRFRSDPDLANVAIVLAGSRRGPPLAEDELALFDAVPSITMPWNPLIEILHQLIEARAGASGPRQEAKPAGNGIPSLAGRRILVAEDVATNEVLLRALLEPTGATIEAVSGGDAALKRQAEAPADLVVMDLQMPGMGGIAAARRIRELESPAGSVPIVALTAYARTTDRERAFAAGMDAFMAKPLVVGDFYDLLRRLLAEGADGP